MNRLPIVLVLIAAVGGPRVLSAQVPTAPPHRSNGVAPSVAGWIATGAGAGFGLGFYLGFRAFDQATYAERKITTAAVVGAAAGGLAGYLVGRLRHDRRPPGSPAVAGRDSDARVWMPGSASFTLRGALKTPRDTIGSLHPDVN